MAQISFSGKRELRWLQEGDCFITFMQADVAIADALWDQWLAAFVAAPGKKRLFASWGDIQPTKEQWRRATRMMRDAKTKVPVVTESRPTSALAKAASWAGADMQAFRWEQLYEASVWLDLDGPQRMAVRTSVTALRDCFGPVDGSGSGARAIASSGPVASSSPRPAATPSPRPAASPSPRPAATPSPRPAATPSPRPAASPSPRPAASPSPRPAASPSPRPAATPSPSPRPAATPAPSNRPAARAPEPQRVVPMRPNTTATTASRTPMADAASRNLAEVRQTSGEIQTKLAEIQARLRNRKRA